MGIEQLTGRLVATIREAQNRKDAATERARAASWLTIQGVARRALAGIPDSSDGKELLKAVTQLGLTADEAADALKRLSEIIDAELDLIDISNAHLTRRTERPPGHIRQRLGDLVRLNPHLHSGEPCDPKLVIDRDLGESIVSHVQREMEVASARRVIDGTGSDPYDTEEIASSTCALSLFVRQCLDRGMSECEVPEALLRGTYLYDLEQIVTRTLFVVQLEEAATRDEAVLGSWLGHVRPTLARVLLNDIRRDRPELFEDVPEGEAVVA